MNPYFDISNFDSALRALAQALAPFGVSKKEIKSALQKAYLAQDDFRSKIFAEGQRIIQKAREKHLPILVLSGRPYHDETLVLSALLDVTSEKESEAETKRSRQMYETAAELAHIAVWIYDIPSHRIFLSSNKATQSDCELYKIPRTIENVPAALSNWIKPQDYAKVCNVYRQIDNGAPFATCDYWYREVNGAKPRCERMAYTTVFDKEGKPLYAYGIGIDITLQEQEKQKYQRTIDTLLSSNPDALGTFRIDLTDNTVLEGHTAANELRDALFAPTFDGFTAKVAAKILSEEARDSYLRDFSREALLARFDEGNVNQTATYFALFPPNHAPMWIRSFFSLITNPDNGHVECVTYATDVTKMKQSEEIFHESRLRRTSDGVL